MSDSNSRKLSTLGQPLPAGVKATAISWTDTTLNFWIGCRRISPGCQNCYAERIVRDRMGRQHWGNEPRWLTKGAWTEAARINRIAANSGQRLKIFANDMSDWAEDHPQINEWRPRMWDVIRDCTALDWQLLTKRADRIVECLPDDWGDGWPNVWLGVSIENEDYVWRADRLREVPAAVRFISYEPALGPLLGIDLSGIDWLIQGGESGPGFRSMAPQWARDIRDQCRRDGVAYFFKQSAAIRTEMGTTLDNETIHEFPDMPTFS